MFHRRLHIRINHLNIKEKSSANKPGGIYKIVSSVHYVNPTG